MDIYWFISDFIVLKIINRDVYYTLQKQIWLIGLGGFFGAILRYSMTVYFSKFRLFPLGTFIVNMSGSLIMGIIAGIEWLSISVMVFISTGFLGAYTTFSTMNFELFKLKQNKRLFLFLLYLISSYSIGIVMAGIGYWLAKALFS